MARIKIERRGGEEGGERKEAEVELQGTESDQAVRLTIAAIFALPPFTNFTLTDPSGAHHVISASLPPRSYTLTVLPEKEISLPPRIAGSHSLKERENMLAGRLYDASDLLLILERERCRKLLQIFNQSPVPGVIPEGGEKGEKGGKGRPDLGLRREILRELFLETGEEEIQSLYIEPPFFCDYGSNVKFGKNVYMNFNCVILDCSEVKIGNNTLFGPNVSLYTASHPLDAKTRIQGPELAYPIEIGDNCWLGGGSTVLGGVKIGRNSVVGAGAVVTSDVPPNSLVLGVPARVVRSLPE